MKLASSFLQAAMNNSKTTAEFNNKTQSRRRQRHTMLFCISSKFSHLPNARICIQLKPNDQHMPKTNPEQLILLFPKQQQKTVVQYTLMLETALSPYS